MYGTHDSIKGTVKRLYNQSMATEDVQVYQVKKRKNNLSCYEVCSRYVFDDFSCSSTECRLFIRTKQTFFFLLLVLFQSLNLRVQLCGASLHQCSAEEKLAAPADSAGERCGLDPD